MELERKQDLSIYYWIKDTVFSDISSFITIVDDFPEELLKLPTIAVDWIDIDVVPFELGNRMGRDWRIWSIDVFGKTKSQRDEYAYRVKNYLANAIPVYNYDEGFPPEVSPSQIGYISANRIKVKKIKVPSLL